MGFIKKKSPHFKYIVAAAIHGIPAEGLTWGAFVLKNLIPVTLGNMVGGMILVGCVGWYLYLRE